MGSISMYGRNKYLGAILVEAYIEKRNLWTSKNSGLGFNPVFCYFMYYSPGTYWIT